MLKAVRAKREKGEKQKTPRKSEQSGCRVSQNASFELGAPNRPKIASRKGREVRQEVKLHERAEQAEWPTRAAVPPMDRHSSERVRITCRIMQLSADGADDTDGAWSYVARLGTNGNLVEDVHFLPVAPLPNGEVHLALRGQRDGPYVLQASSDLIQWTTVATNDRPAVPIGFIDRDAGRFPQRFYRVH